MPACIICQDAIPYFSRPDCKSIDSQSLWLLCPDCTSMYNQRSEWHLAQLVKLAESCLEQVNCFCSSDEDMEKYTTPPHPSIFF